MTRKTITRKQWLEFAADAVESHLRNGDKNTASMVIADELRSIRGNPVAAIVASLFDGSHSSGQYVELRGGKRGKRRRDDFELMQDAICRLVIDKGEPLEAALAAISAGFGYSRSHVHAAYKERAELWKSWRESERRMRDDPELVPYFSSEIMDE